MIAKIPEKRKDGKSSFKKLVDYNTKPKAERHDFPDERILYVNSQNIEDPENAALEMKALAALNTRCKDPAYHFVLSWRENEFPTSKQVDEAVGIALKELGFEECQAIWGLQGDTDHRHVHVAVNRIHPESLRAMQPDNGWDKKGLERAARKIEFAQGWEIEKTGRYTVTEDGEIVENRGRKEKKKDEPKISQTARDIESHTGGKSAERIAQEQASPIIRAAKSWEELHEKLAEQGIRYEKKGSGAILWIAETAVKASKVHKDFSLSKLQARLGPYQERDKSAVSALNSDAIAEETKEVNGNVDVNKTPPVSEKQQEPKQEPIEKIAADPKVKKGWDTYQTARREYLKTKAKAKTELSAKHKAERDELRKKYKAAQKKLYEVSWRGKGEELNQHRSILAAQHKREHLDLFDRQIEERGALKKRYPERFPSFKSWLSKGDQEISALFLHPNNLVFSGTGNSYAPHIDLRDYRGISGNMGSVAYFLRGDEKRAADFVDYGRQITISKNCDEASVLAAFQLASQKWGAVHVSGSAEYKKLCVLVAAKNNFKIANPDLQAEVEKIKAEKKRKGKEFRSRKDFEEYAKAIGAERYRISATENTENGVKTTVLGKKKNSGLEWKTRKEIADAMPKILAQSEKGKSINVTPLSRDKHHILIDDMTDSSVSQLKEDGYAPCCIIQTSPGKFQAVITIPKLGLEQEKEREAAAALTKDLNRQYGNPEFSATGGLHAHRLPPFPNTQGNKGEDGEFPDVELAESNGGQCSKAAEQLKEIHEQIKQEPLNKAYWAHCQDVLSRQQDRPSPDPNINGKIGLRMRITGFSPEQIYDAIRNNAPVLHKEMTKGAEGNEKAPERDWNTFAKKTVEEHVFGTTGEKQYREAEPYRSYYLNVEGRGGNKQEKAAKNTKDLGR